ncbi:MAG TPA: DUF4142 domain-containing protein [Gemmataceae bacterium]|nr:DUF4142 domain-containing protein [Gemmataceae bacterium]
MNRKKTFAVAMMFGMGLWLAALTATADEEKTKAAGDSEFFSQASAAGLAEVNFSELAVRLTRNSVVKEFAERILADHMRANRELTQLANQRSIALAKEMDEGHQKKYDKLKKLSGAEFDRTYMEGMVKDHEEAVKLYEKEAKNGKDDTTKEWAGKLTPILKKHLEHAREVCQKCKDENKKE